MGPNGHMGRDCAGPKWQVSRSFVSEGLPSPTECRAVWRPFCASEGFRGVGPLEGENTGLMAPDPAQVM